MIDPSSKKFCIFHVFEGLCEGLSNFSGNSRVALIFAIKPEDHFYIYDPNNLLKGHESRIYDIYIATDEWKNNTTKMHNVKFFEEVNSYDNVILSGLISYGGSSKSIFYQMWFTEHHPDICSTGPTQRWLEHAAWLLSQDFATENILCISTSGYVLQDYDMHAVRDYIVDARIKQIGWDTPIRVYPILKAVIGISKTLEEGEWPQGELIFVEPKSLKQINFLAHFPYNEQPILKNFKHIRKLLLCVENSNRKLISDGQNIVGIAIGNMPLGSIIVNFRKGHGFLKLNEELICSFANGKFYSSTRRAKLVQVEETLIESLQYIEQAHILFKIITQIIHKAEDKRYGATVVIDLNMPPLKISGQHLKKPLDLRDKRNLELAMSLAKLDGALHICTDMKLYGFACLLDGHSIEKENRARGARFNSALRFSAEQKNIIIVVVSSDQPVSIIKNGKDLTAKQIWPHLCRSSFIPLTIESWLEKSKFLQ